MIRKKYIKTLVSCFLVLMALWVATPRVYIHNLLHHNHNEATGRSAETEVKSETTDDCDFDKYDKPVYFNIFKFIFSFIPVKPQDKDKVSDRSHKLGNISYAISLLRAPPLGK